MLDQEIGQELYVKYTAGEKGLQVAFVDALPKAICLTAELLLL
jgi:hypothetical protein